MRTRMTAGTRPSPDTPEVSAVPRDLTGTRLPVAVREIVAVGTGCVGIPLNTTTV